MGCEQDDEDYPQITQIMQTGKVVKTIDAPLAQHMAVSLGLTGTMSLFPRGSASRRRSREIKPSVGR